MLLIFNNPKVESSIKLLTRLTQESKIRSSQENLASGGGRDARGHNSGRKGASGKGGSSGTRASKGGEVDESYINSGESKYMCTCTY